MKSRWLMSLLLLMVVALSACQLESPASEPIKPAGDYPAPLQENSPPEQESYPAPQVQPTKPSILYPGPQDGDEVSWNQAVAMIMNGEVTQIIQTHSLEVTLMLKDGRSLITIEPKIDDVFIVIERCGDECEDIAVATE